MITMETNRKLITHYFKPNTSTVCENRELSTEKHTTKSTDKPILASTDKQTPTMTEPNKSTTLKYYPVTYISGLTNKVQKTLTEWNIDNFKLANKPRNQLAKMYSKTKDPIPLLQQTNVVYKINCTQCTDSYYIGQTSQHLETRIKQHKQNCKSKISKYNVATGLSSHCTTLKHEFNFKHPEILHTETNDNKRKIIESLYITKHMKNTVNNQNDMDNLNFFYANLINKIKF